MKISALPAIASVVLLAFPPVALAKGQIAKIIVHGEDLPALEITDPTILDSFDIWQGPGVRVNGKPVHLNPDEPGPAFIDWINGEVVERPSGLRRYKITFAIDGRVRGAYVVHYEFNPVVVGGYIHLPGKGDPHFPENVALIAHGVEGRWFHSSASWERLVRPLIVTARDLH